MANHVALLDKLRTGERYFIVHGLIFLKSECTTVELLELGTRRLIRQPYSEIVKLIQDGTLKPWDAIQ